MPQMIFKASCPECAEERKFIEFKAEPCGPHADTRENRYGFRCLQCKTILETPLEDSAGRTHRWENGQHVEA